MIIRELRPHSPHSQAIKIQMSDIYLQSKEFALSMDWGQEALTCHEKAFDSILSSKDRSVVLNRIAKWNLYHCNFFASFENYVEARRLDKNNSIAQANIEKLRKFPTVAGININVETEINDTRTLKGCVELLLLVGLKDRARSILETNIHRFNTYHEQNEMAKCMRKIDPKSAIKVYDSCYLSHPNNVSLVGKSACLMDLERFLEAESILEPIFQMLPDDPYVLRTVARLKRRLGTREEVDRLFAKADAIEDEQVQD